MIWACVVVEKSSSISVSLAQQREAAFFSPLLRLSIDRGKSDTEGDEAETASVDNIRYRLEAERNDCRDFCRETP
jgi:hypothetical protein